MSDAAGAEGVAAALARVVAERTGVRDEVVRVREVARLADADGAAALARPERLEALLPALLPAAVVAETYLDRHPEQLRCIVEGAVARWRASGRPRLLAWSAGCATGEEAWSLAAALEHAGLGAAAEVLGTDLLARHVEAAVRARYGRWSRRDVGPVPWRALDEEAAPRSDAPGRDDARAVAPALRARARFAVHNLLDPPPVAAGACDLVVCRNVLVYFRPEAARLALAHLARALAPDGVLALGPADLAPGIDRPPGLSAWGPPEAFAWTRDGAGAAPPRRPRAPATPAARGATAPAAAPRASASPDEAAAPAPTPAEAPPPGLGPGGDAAAGPAACAHRAALEAVEAGDLDRALVHLDAAERAAPAGAGAGAWLAVERALVLARLGRRTAARDAARRALAATEGLPEDHALPGPTPRTAAWVRRAARDLLARLGAPP